MRYLIFVFLCVTACKIKESNTTSAGDTIYPQRSTGNGPSVPAEDSIRIKPRFHSQAGNGCVKSKSLKKADLIKTFPFERTEKIQLVSFGPGYTESIPIKDGKVDTLSFKETKKLDSQQEEKLIDILFNYTFNTDVYDDSIPQEVMMCYNPRNAILFKDKHNYIVAYIEICFECLQYKKSTNINIGDFCHDKFGMLKTFFRKNKVMFGTTESE